MEKENNTNESDFSENEIPDLNSLKPFEFEPKSNIIDINSSSSGGGASAAQKQLLADVLQNRRQVCNLVKKRPRHRCFPRIFTKF